MTPRECITLVAATTAFLTWVAAIGILIIMYGPAS